MSDEEQIVAKPPSHPVVTGLLVASVVGAALNIAVVWRELFSTYLNTAVPTKVGPNDKVQHNPLTYAKKDKTVHDYFAVDFSGRSVEDDLGLKSQGQ